MVLRKGIRKGQAAIEFLMTYGWMLLVVLIVGALIFSFVDFGGLLPNKVDLSNNLRGDQTGSAAYSNDASNGANNNSVKVLFKYTGAKRVIIPTNKSYIKTELGEQCNATTMENLDTGETANTVQEISVLNSQEVLGTFDCSSTNGGTGLIQGDALVGTITINVKNPKSGIEVPSTGAIRLQII